MRKRAKRWLLWTFRCRRGRRCAHLVLDSASEIPLPFVMMARYSCAACGTLYEHIVSVEDSLEDELDQLGLTRQGHASTDREDG